MKEMLGVIRNSVCYAKLDVKFVGTHAGLGVEDDGGSHQSLLEPAIFADLPGIKCYEPADANETVDVMEMVWKENVAAYIRLTRQGLLILDRHYALEKDVGVYPVLVNEDLALQKQTYLIGSGAGVGLCLEAAQVLLDKGVKCSVLNVVGLGDVDRLRNLVKKNALVVTVHDAYCKSLAQRVSLVLSDGSHVSNVIGLGLQGFGESGKLNELYAKHGMDVDSIVQNVLNALV